MVPEAAVVNHIHEAGVRRRWHPRDVSSHKRNGHVFQREAPNVHNSLAIQKKHVQNMYRSWSSFNSHAHGPLDTDRYARHVPVGRVLAERSSTAPLTETELGNMYAGSFVFAPGPCAYGMWKDNWCAQRGPTLGQAPRKCMVPGEGHPQLPHGKRRTGGSPGPGAYTTGDSAVMGHRGGTFAAMDERRGAAAALELATGQLKTLEWRIGMVRRGLREPESLRPGQALVVKTQSGRELARMEANAARLRTEVERFGVAVSEATKRDPLPGATLAGPVDSRGVRGNRRRPSTTTGAVGTGKRHQACGLGADRFYDPLMSTATFQDSPGPGTYSLATDDGGLGKASLRRSPSFDMMQRRVVGQQAAAGRSLVSLQLHSTGGGCTEHNNGLAPYHSYVCEAGPGQYTPDMCAPPLPNHGGNRRRSRYSR